MRRKLVQMTILGLGCLLIQGLCAAVVSDEGRVKIDEVIQKHIDAKKIPGAVVIVGHGDQQQSFVKGVKGIAPDVALVETDIFDLASLTKSVATTTCVMRLLEEGQLQLYTPVHRWLPEFQGDGRERITLAHLLTHSSGLPAGIARDESCTTYAEGLRRCLSCRPEKMPGTMFRYSDVNFMLLGEIVFRVTGKNLQEYANEILFQPLGLSSTRFNPTKEWDDRLVPTAPLEAGQWLKGIVHDPTSRFMGGVTGHAGLFSSAVDLARFSRMIVNGGSLDGVQILKPETVQLMAKIHSPPLLEGKRGLGWDLDSSYSRTRGKGFPLGTLGHTGFTGTSMWLDPQSQSYVIVLTSRLFPRGRGGALDLQEEVATLFTEYAVNWKKEELKPAFLSQMQQAHPSVLNGLDVLLYRNFDALKGKKVGLITNHTARDRDGRSIIDLLHEAENVDLKVLFSPEHGIRGTLDHEKILDAKDEKTGLPIYSLYQDKLRAPKQEQLKDLDVLVFDIQDIGCRFYTYISTLKNGMQAAATAGIKMLVLDRVNPLGGLEVLGPILVDEMTFVGCHAIPVQHGMTVGELALLMNAEATQKCELEVIAVEGWQRSIGFESTGLTWISPSPNMRNLQAAKLYPGVGLVEFAVSVGRGTDTPFEVLGAPFIDERLLARTLNLTGLNGLAFVPIRFTPTAGPYKDQECGGVRIQITDAAQMRPLELGIALITHLHKMYPHDFSLEKVNRLLLSTEAISWVKKEVSWQRIVSRWEMEIQEFLERRQPYLLYP